VEQDPAELLASVVAAGWAAIARAGVVVHGIGLANQGETVLAWDPDTGRPLTTAVSWQDRRAVSVTDDLADHRARLEEITGLPLDPYGALVGRDRPCCAAGAAPTRADL
jgi:glycerol kinase